MPSGLQPDRTLGRTGVQVPLIVYGTAPLGREAASRQHAVHCLNHAIAHGLTYLDTSPDYGSEPHLGEVMKHRRDEVFLATKINCRSKGGVLGELKQSLLMLQTDHVDLIQVHAVNAWADLEQALAPDGACAALEEARDQGLVRFIGITGHARPDVLAQALQRYPFDTVLVALGIGDRLVSNPECSVLPAARERNTDVIAMKVYGHGAYPNRERCLRYSLSLPGVCCANIGLDNIDHIDEVIRLAQAVEPLSHEEMQQLVDEVQPILEQDAREGKQGRGSLFWLRDTTVMGWSHQDEPAMVDY